MKNFNIYLESILNYAKACNIKVIFVEPNKDWHGLYSPHRRSIYINKELKEELKISCLLHELGHYLDDCTNPRSFTSKSINSGLEALEKSKDLTDPQKRAIIRQEKKAWKYAQGIAKQLKIPLGKWFFRDKKSNLLIYIKLVN